MLLVSRLEYTINIVLYLAVALANICEIGSQYNAEHTTDTVQCAELQYLSVIVLKLKLPLRNLYAFQHISFKIKPTGRRNYWKISAWPLPY
jgi:hypothetical protein